MAYLDETTGLAYCSQPEIGYFGEGYLTGRLVAGLLCLMLFAGSAAAEDYPAHPIRLVVPYPAGGANAEFRDNLAFWAGVIKPLNLDLE